MSERQRFCNSRLAPALLLSSSSVKTAAPLAISPARFARASTALRILALILTLVLAWVVSPVLPAIAFGGFVALVGHGPYERLVAMLRGRRMLTAALATAATTIAVLVPIGATLLYGAREASLAMQSLQTSHVAQDLSDALPSALAAHVPALLEAGRDAARQIAAGALLPKALGSAGRFLVFCLLTVVVLLFSLRDGPRFVTFLLEVSPLERHETEALLREFRAVALGLFRGGVLVALYHGASAALGLVLFSIPHAPLLGMLCGIASFVPVIGTGLIGIPVVAGQFVAGHTARALGLAIWFMVVVGAGDHVFRPVVSKGQMALPRPLLFLTIFGGLFLLGPAGVLLGPLAGSLAVVALRLVRQ